VTAVGSRAHINNPGDYRMLIRLDAFAEMLKIRSGMLLRAARSSGQLEGITLPRCQQSEGSRMTFDYEEALLFAKAWHARPRKTSPDEQFGSENLVTLISFAEQTRIPTVMLYDAVCHGKKLRGILPPVPVVKNPQLLFSAEAVSLFLLAYNERAR